MNCEQKLRKNVAFSFDMESFDKGVDDCREATLSRYKK